jgi:Flp pilus assembly protein TadG
MNWWRKPGSRRRGNALIEFVFMLPFYGTCLFGALEFTQIFYDRLQLNNACREGVRRMAVGQTLDEVKSLIQVETPTMGITADMVVLEYYDEGTSAWVAASDNGDGTANAVPTDYLCRVRIVNWPHPMKTGAYFKGILGTDGATFPMSALDIMLRE